MLRNHCINLQNVAKENCLEKEIQIREAHGTNRRLYGTYIEDTIKQGRKNELYTRVEIKFHKARSCLMLETRGV